MKELTDEIAETILLREDGYCCPYDGKCSRSLQDCQFQQHYETCGLYQFLEKRREDRVKGGRE